MSEGKSIKKGHDVSRKTKEEIIELIFKNKEALITHIFSLYSSYSRLSKKYTNLFVQNKFLKRSVKLLEDRKNHLEGLHGKRSYANSKTRQEKVHGCDVPQEKKENE